MNEGRRAMVSAAVSALGRGGESFVSWFNAETGGSFPPGDTPWCAIFTCWCASLAGAEVPLTAGCTSARRVWQADGRWAGRKRVPRPGDLVYFDWDESGDCDHTGVVEECAGGVIHTVEGNSSGAVRRRSYGLTDSRIAGYGLPDFGDGDEDFGGAPEWLIEEGAARWAVENGVFRGDGGDLLAWERPITRAEAAAAIYRAAALILNKKEG